MRSVFYDTSNTMFRVKLKFACSQERVVDEERPGPVFQRLMRRSQQSILSCGLTSGVWWWKCLHEFGCYVEKWNINVWRLNLFASWTCSFFAARCYASAAYVCCQAVCVCVCPRVCVCLSRSYILPKRINISSKLFHLRVATPF